MADGIGEMGEHFHLKVCSLLHYGIECSILTGKFIEKKAFVVGCPHWLFIK